MQCPRCKQEIENNSLKCSHCSAKVGSICKDCGTYNLINAQTCSGCGKMLIHICPECSSANLPDARLCRKCGAELISVKKKPDYIKPAYAVPANSQNKAKSKLVEGIKDCDTKIITLCGESGIGKNLVLRSGLNELKNAKLIWLFGTCTQVTQLSPFGYFQDLLLTFFNINNFCPDTLQLKKNSLKFFKQDFPSLSNSETLDLLNFLYPDNLDKYENIYLNKAKMFIIMKKVILTIIEKIKAVFIIDGFEYIDGMSYDFIKELLKESFVFERSKFIILSSVSRPGMGLITSPDLKENNYLDLPIAPFTDGQIETFLKQYDFDIDKGFVKLASGISGGNPAVIEQMVLLRNDAKRNNLKKVNYNNLKSIIDLRLNILRKEDLPSYRMLAAMSVLGVKFYPAMLENFDNNPPEEFERIISKLIDSGFITQLNNLSFEFKCGDIWKAVVSVVKNDECFEEILNILYEILSIYRQSSIALLGYILQKLSNNDKAFEIWTLLMKQACFIGDIGLYIIVQKQALKLIESKTSPFYQKVKKNIYTRVGKLLEPIDYEAAFEYLQNAVMMLNEEDESEHIELLGYLASCSMKSGNYCGALECINSVLNELPEDKTLEKILVKSRQTTPLLKLGNYGQLIISVETEIIPEIEKILNKGKDTPQIKLKDLFDIWLAVYFDYAEALIFQGDSRSFEVIRNLYNTIDKNKVTETAIICRTNLLLAAANTIKGDLATSGKILDDMLQEYSLDSMDPYVISRWNFIDILNKFFNEDYKTLSGELFNVTAYANNINDHYTKNILKTLLAKIFKENSQTKKALEILEEQVAYFAKEKIAAGVLLSWYLIAEIKLITKGTQFALDIAVKALDIAQGPNINNYYFMVVFNKLIGEIYLAKQDFDSAKVYLEKSVFIAKQFDLQHILVKSYLQSAKLYQELALPKSSMRGSYIKQALKMFQLAKNVPVVSEHTVLQKNIKEDFNIFTSFCKLNGIELKKESK